MEGCIIAADNPILQDDDQPEQVAMLRAMLTVAEGEIRAKDAQIELISEMLGANDQASSLYSSKLATPTHSNPALSRSYLPRTPVYINSWRSAKPATRH